MRPNPKASGPKSSWRWPMIVVGLLMVHVALMMTATFIVLQRSGESAVISDYYDKAQAYDAYKAQVAASDQLGWKVNLEQTGQADALGSPQVRVNLMDARSEPISGATVSVHCFHWSHGDQAATLSADAVAAGQYTVALPAKYSGFWQFDITAQSGKQTFIRTVTQFIN